MEAPIEQNNNHEMLQAHADAIAKPGTYGDNPELHAKQTTKRYSELKRAWTTIAMRMPKPKTAVTGLTKPSLGPEGER